VLACRTSGPQDSAAQAASVQIKSVAITQKDNSNVMAASQCVQVHPPCQERVLGWGMVKGMGREMVTACTIMSAVIVDLMVFTASTPGKYFTQQSPF
jgi:hypothetical protein